MKNYEEIDFFTNPEVVNDTPGYIAHLRSKAPVTREPFHGAFMVTGYDEFLEVCTKQGDVFSAAVSINGPIPPLPFAPEGDDITDQLTRHRKQMPWTDHISTMDGAQHAADRALLARLLTHTRLKANEEYIVALIERMIDRLIDRGGCEIMQDFAKALTTLLVADLLGVPDADRQDLVDALGLPPTQLGGDAEHKVQSDPLAWLFDRFHGYLVERRENPCGDFLSDLAQSTYRDGSKPDLAVLARLSCFMFGAGDTTARLIAFCFRVLGDCPDIQARVRADPDLIPAFIEEVLRLENPVKVVSRIALRPTSVGGVPISPGAIVTMTLVGANRDPQHFSNPDDFDLERPNVRDQVAFGRGVHACIGAPLARMEVRRALEAFLRRTSDIRISEAHHGPREARDYTYEHTYLLSGLQELHVEWDKA